MFAIFRKRASKLSAELVELRMKEEDLAKRAQAHIEAGERLIAYPGMAVRPLYATR